MRYPKDHKETSRKKVIQAAARSFRARGIAATGIEEVMRGAGLTKGAFSLHFKSKEELVRAALHESALHSPIYAAAAEIGSLEEMAAHYLDAAHRDHPEWGCPAAALASEIAQQPKGTRMAFADDLKRILAFAEERLPKGKSAAARREIALSALATMVGTLQLSRLIPDKAVSDQILATGKKAVSKLLA